MLDTVKHPAMCAQRLVTEALARGSGDNVACLVAFLSGRGQGHSTGEWGREGDEGGAEAERWLV